MRLFIQLAWIGLTALILIAFKDECKVHARDGGGGGFWRCGDKCIAQYQLLQPMTFHYDPSTYDYDLTETWDYDPIKFDPTTYFDPDFDPRAFDPAGFDPTAFDPNAFDPTAFDYNQTATYDYGPKFKLVGPEPLCHCGSTILQFGSESWCCSDQPCSGLGSWQNDIKFSRRSGGWMGGANCTNGKVLPFSQPCKGKCHENKMDFFLYNNRSYIPCTQPDKTKNVTQCIPQSKKNDQLFTCVNRADENPYSTYGLIRSTNFDLNVILETCTTGNGSLQLNLQPGRPGLRCPSPSRLFGLEECAPFWIWCKSDVPNNNKLLHPNYSYVPYCDYGGIGFLMTDPRICSNTSFWQQHTCEHSEYKRCNGTNPGQCIRVDQECEEDLPDLPYLNPSDKTLDLDNLLPQCDSAGPGLRCPKYYIEGCLPFTLWCQKLKGTTDCGYGVLSTDPRICGNVTFWKNKPCREGLHRCNGKYPGQCGSLYDVWGLEPEPCSDGSDSLEPLPESGDCQERLKCHPRQTFTVTNSKGEPVSVNETDEVCLDKKLICDFHPQCQGGEDEDPEECKQAYLDKGFFRQDETFICRYPFHEVTLPDGRTGKLCTHRAIRCNANPECWGGEDEMGCNVIEAIAQYVIRKFILM